MFSNFVTFNEVSKLSTTIHNQLKQINYSDEVVDLIRERVDTESLNQIVELIEDKKLANSIALFFLFQCEKVIEKVIEKSLVSVFTLAKRFSSVMRRCRSFLVTPACKAGNLDIIKYLASIGVNLHNNNYIHMAAEHGHIHLIEYFIDNGVDIHYRDDKILTYACKSGSIDIVKYLVEKGCDVRADKDDPLIVSSDLGYKEIVKYLVEKGADVRASSDSALRLACIRGHLDVVKYLVERPDCKVCKERCCHGAKITAVNDQPILRSIQYKHFEIVKYLVEKGARLPETALDLAITLGDVNVIKYLIEECKMDISKITNPINSSKGILYTECIEYFESKFNIKLKIGSSICKNICDCGGSGSDSDSDRDSTSECNSDGECILGCGGGGSGSSSGSDSDSEKFYCPFRFGSSSSDDD